MHIAMIHNPSSTSARSATGHFDGEDPKYAVADILSSFGAADNSTPLNLSTALSPTTTTDILTPTTLANLEQTFLELQSTVAPTATSTSLPRESGFVPPVLGPNRPTTSQMVKHEYDYSLYQDDSSQDPDWMPSSSKRPRYTDAAAMGQVYETDAPVMNRRRRKRDETVTPEEEARRDLRRERNKLAAAKCRQRRVDLTNKLLYESEGLEEEQSKLENEIQMLQHQKDQLEFLLDAHKPVCSAGVTGSSDSSGATAATSTVLDPQVAIKSEKVDFSYPSVLTTATIGTSTHRSALTCSSMMSRPNTLLIPSSSRTSCTVTEATGVPITTPSGVFNFGLESMLDGHTGLTPITGTPSCASQMHRASTDGSSSPSENLSSPTTLMAL